MHRFCAIVSLLTLVITSLSGCSALMIPASPANPPALPTLTITGVAKDVHKDSQLIVLDEPSHPVSILWLTSDSTIQTISGQAISLEGVWPGATLEATGQSQGNGILIVYALIVVANPTPAPIGQLVPTATPQQAPLSATATPVSGDSELISITGWVTSVSPSAGILELAEPANGITVIAFTDRTEIIAQDNGSIRILDILPGMEITASGTRGNEATLIANTVYIIGQGTSGITIIAPVTGAIVPNPVHVQGNLRLLSSETRLVARVIDEREQVVGETQLELETDVEERLFIVSIPYSVTVSGPGTIEILALKADNATAAEATVEVILVPPQVKPIEGRVLEVVTETRTIKLAAAVDGFALISLTEGTRILTTDGTLADLSEISSGAIIRVTGHSGGGGELVATEIQVVNTSPQEISIQSPRAGETVTSPLRLVGSVQLTPFEATLHARIINEQGSVLGEGPILVRGEIGELGTFTTEIKFDESAVGQGALEVQEINPRDGSIVYSRTVDILLYGGAQPHFDGTVGEIMASERRIRLSEATQGYEIIAITKDTVLLSADDSEILLTAITPGMILAITGVPENDTTLIAIRVRILEGLPD